MDMQNPSSGERPGRLSKRTWGGGGRLSVKLGHSSGESWAQSGREQVAQRLRTPECVPSADGGRNCDRKTVKPMFVGGLFEGGGRWWGLWTAALTGDLIVLENIL